ncbi:pyrroloquinoline quinone precursor peptide PqqA [Rugamonas apoptosis]
MVRKPCPHGPGRSINLPIFKETAMQWSKPEFIDFRFGFEITLYIANR